MKRIARKLVAKVLYWQVRRLRSKNNFQTVAVAGSVGKTSTKLAIASVLGSKYKVRHQEGNYNDLITVPLIFFGRSLKSLFNPLGWLGIFISNEIQLHRTYPFDVVVLELGTDGPGYLPEFKRYIKPLDIGVLTAITPEHMEYFADLDAVASEESVISELSTLTMANKDTCVAKYLKPDYLSYAINQPADYQMTDIVFDETGANFEVLAGGKSMLAAKHEAVTEPLLYAILAAAAVGHKLAMTGEEIEAGIAKIKPARGRMSILSGINNSKIIDDTYNASPEAVKAALKTLYRLSAPHKIALLGNMNELGKYSADAHKEIGHLCDPAKLDLVVTLGPDANAYLAPAVKERGCKVQTFEDPYSAGEFIKGQLQDQTLILVKGSQNKVFAEETVKLLLADPADAGRLVRQSKKWLSIKHRAFTK